MVQSKASVTALFVAVFWLASVSLSATANAEVDNFAENAAPCNWTGPSCTTDCHDVPDGVHQWCNSCSKFVICHQWSIFGIHPCPSGLVWDDKEKDCRKTSSTCFCYPEPETCKTTGSRCIRSCAGLKDGDYQSCHGCSVYASCVGGYLYDYRPCAPAWPRPPLQWDDITKRCLYTSRTCKCSRNDEPEQDRLSWSEILKK